MTDQAKKTLSVSGAVLIVAGFIGSIGVGLSYLAPVLAVPTTILAHTNDIQELQEDVSALKTNQAVIQNKLDTIEKQLETLDKKQDQVLIYLRK